MAILYDTPILPNEYTALATSQSIGGNHYVEFAGLDSNYGYEICYYSPNSEINNITSKIPKWTRLDKTFDSNGMILRYYVTGDTPGTSLFALKRSIASVVVPGSSSSSGSDDLSPDTEGEGGNVETDADIIDTEMGYVITGLSARNNRVRCSRNATIETAENNIINTCKTFIDTSKFNVAVSTTTYDEFDLTTGAHNWEGTISLYSINDPTIIRTSDTITLELYDAYYVTP